MTAAGWFFLVVAYFVTPTPSDEQSLSALGPYPTEQECQTARRRMVYELADARLWPPEVVVYSCYKRERDRP